MLLVTGHPRSGTTVLQEVLNSHPDIGLTNELQCFVGVGKRVGLRYLRRLLRRGLRLRNHSAAFAPPGTKRWTWAYNARCTTRFAGGVMRRWKRPLDVPTLERAYHGVYPGARWVGDKSPTYVFDLGHYLDLGLKCVVIYRDCRDVVASTLEMVRTAWRGMPHAAHLDAPDKVAHRWVDAIEIMQRYEDRIAVIRYEDLVEEPMPVLAKLAADLDIDPARLPGDLVRSSSVGRYRDELSTADQKVIENIAGPVMEQLGYGHVPR